MEISEYRQQIMELLLEKKKPNGQPAIDKESAEMLLSQLTDAELAEGMPFNTPDEVANLIVETHFC